MSRDLRRMLSVCSMIIMLMVIGVAGEFRTVSAQETGTVVWDSYDVTIDVQTDRSFLITERMAVDFSGERTFTFGFADIPLDRVTAITEIAVAEETAAGLTPFDETFAQSGTPDAETFYAASSRSNMHIEYGFSPAENETRTFILTYRAEGALRVYPNENPPSEQVYWNAISTEVTNVAPIRSSSVTVILPEPVALDAILLGEDTTGPATDHTQDGQQWQWSKQGLDQGDSFVVRMQFPTITGSAAPAWQEADDQRRADKATEDRRRTQVGGVGAALGLAILSLSAFLLTRLFQSKGRDPQVGLVAEILNQPPDDLSPALAGALIDESAGTKEIVATMLYLAEQGVFAVEEEGGEKFSVRYLSSPGSLAPHEQRLVNALFPGEQPDSSVSLDTARKEISAKASTITESMEEELVNRGMFEASPSSVRQHWTLIGAALLIGGILLAIILGQFTVTIIAGIILGIALGIVGIATIIVGQGMPRKTLIGAESAARWRAFKRYLEEIKPFEAQAAIAEDPLVFERNMPFATAFGIDKEWLRRFTETNAPAPRWFVPIGGYGYGSTGHRSDGGNSGGGLNIPSAQGMSNSAMGSLAVASASMSSFMNSAATAFTPPSSSGGSGGGFSGGGGGGGGGGRGFG